MLPRPAGPTLAPAISRSADLAAERQRQRLAAMTPVERIMLALRLGRVGRALAVRPDDRYPDLDALLAALGAAARPPRRRHVGWWVAGGGALGLALGAAALTLRREPAPEEVGAPASYVEAIAAEVATRIEIVMACYEASASQAVGENHIDIEFEIAADGTVAATRVIASTLPDQGAAARCIAAASLQWHFPPPPRAGMKIRYPFEFGGGT